MDKQPNDSNELEWLNFVDKYREYTPLLMREGKVTSSKYVDIEKEKKNKEKRHITYINSCMIDSILNSIFMKKKFFRKMLSKNICELIK